MRQQVATWSIFFVTGFVGLALVPDANRVRWLGTLGWVFSMAVPLSEAGAVLLASYGLFALCIAYFIPRYERGGLGDSQGTIRQALFPFRASALTFDDGPSPVWTPRILDVLGRYHVKATFFMVGMAVEKYPEVAAEVARRGHTIGSHGWSHACLPLLDARTLIYEIEHAAAAIEKAVGKRPLYFRPPWGLYNRRVLDELRQRGYLTVLWSRSSQDWRNPGAETIVDLAARSPVSGDILLFHDGGNYPSATIPNTSRQQTMEALPLVIERLEKPGFQLKSIDDVVAAWLA